MSSMKDPRQQRASSVYVALAALLLVVGLCNGVKPAGSQQMLDGAEEIGIIGSMRHQTNVVPTQRNQLIREQDIANEHEHTAMMQHQAKMKRETPGQNATSAGAPGAVAAPSSSQQAPQVAAPNTTNKKDQSETSSPPSSFSDKLKEQMNKAGQQIQSYGDQLVAQIPKRLRRQAQHLDHLGEHGTGNSHGAGNGYAHNSDSHANGHGHGQGNGYGYGSQNHNHDNNNDYGNSNGHSHSNTNSGPNSASSSNSKLAELGEKLNSARQLVQTIRERCAEGYRQPSHNDRPQRLRRQDGQSDLSSERASKLGELGEKLRNRTNEAQRRVQSIRQHCAESLGSTQGDGGTPVRHRRQAPIQPQQPAAAQAAPAPQQTPVAAPGSGAANSPLATFTDQVRNQTSTAIQQLQSLRDQFVASVGPMIEKQIPKRLRRQIQYPSGSPEQAPQVGTNGQSSGGIMKYLGDLGQQAAQAQAISQLFQAAGASGSQKTDNPLASLGQSSSSSSPSGGLNSVAQVMAQLTDLIKSTQDRNARLLESNQRSLEATNQQTVEAAKSAQGGIQSALSEMGQGLQKLAANNPNLLPDIKNLYQTVSSRLSSASSAVAQTANGGQQEPARSLPVAQS